MVNEFIKNKKLRVPRIWIFVLLGLVLLVAIILIFLFKKGVIKKFFEPKPGSCLILTEGNCKKMKIIEINNNKVAVANLNKGTVLFSPVSGIYNNTVTITTKSNIKDFGAVVNSNDLNSYTFIYSKESERKNNDNYAIKLGEQIGTIDIVKLKNFSDYNLIFYISKEEQNGVSTLNNDFLLKIFSNK